MRRALRRAATSRRIVILSALLLIVGPVSGTWAYFSASTVSATSQFTGGWVGEASAGSVTPSGYDGALSWTKATHVDTVTGQTVTYADQGTTSNCTSPTYSGTVGAVGTGTSFTTSGFTSALNGHYVCFKLVTADNNWSSQGYVFPVAHLGLFPTAVALANGGTHSGRAESGDTITITWNQAVSTTGIPANNATIDVCFRSNTIIVGDTAGCAAAGDAFNIAKITGMTFTGTYNANTSVFHYTGGTSMSVTIGGTSFSSAISGTGVFTAATTVKSAVTTDQASACTAAANGCTPSATGSW